MWRRWRRALPWVLPAVFVGAVAATAVGMTSRPLPSASLVPTAAPSASTVTMARRDEPRDRSVPPPPSPTPVPILPGQPPLATGLRAQLDCDQLTYRGREVPDYGIYPGAGTATAAFEQFIELHYAPWLPLRGYAVEPLGDHWSRLVYAPQGRTKALAVATDRAPEFADEDWHIVGLLACASVEFDPADGLSTGDATWADPRGRPIAPDVIEQRGDCYGGTQLRLRGRLYVRDPLGAAYEPQYLLDRYDGHATLPMRAIATQFRDGDRRLFGVPDRSVVYVVTPTTTERWPRVRGDAYDRLDCN